ncbi:TIGR03619 family F420-dependent LLM class oxidoreductase [Cryptosporangium aurantiacum]|uniref:Probable F420-dependent oxidoreductase, Rv2161c family n=1 Tax=Cryptosporangium aurantiacum TaxID=134849 RepID=A0A1M7RPU8_9ACTN|nr:TIGR03619 family F420-dependent LLM class oxidoreductase [Cryptosporangium aurantiacum]SHN48112.1 probable F420-dependent oxidoreductase, Rv2161c family [Cryptosporangium aurantiacum]
MKLGLNVRNFGPSADPKGLRAWARFAEDAGFALAMMSDHVASTPDVDETYPAPFYDPFTTISWLAALTTTLELGTSVTIAPYRHPLQTARVVANIDRFSDGRFVLGVASGWSEPEFAALGVPYARRGAMTDDHLRVLVDFWTRERISHDSEFVTFTDVATGPAPVRRPHPPIWVGGAAPVAIRRAARFGDAWHPANPDLTWLRDIGLPALRDAAAVLGKPAPPVAPRVQLDVRQEHVELPDRPAGTGTLEQIAADLDTIAALGASYVVLDTNPGDPHDRRSLREDFYVLETVARHWRDQRS